MPDRQNNQQRLRRLLAQEPEIQGIEMEKFRIELTDALQTYEAKAKRARRRIVLVGTIYALVGTAYLASTSLLKELMPVADLPAWWRLVTLLLFLASLGAVVVGILLVGLYLFRYLPKLSRTRFDLQTAMFLELQQRMKQLQEDVSRLDKP